MVMGFALCASVAFAQTARISRDDARKMEKAPVNATKAAVDYKASVFSKAGGHDTIQVFKIDNASDYTIGLITAADRINDTLVGSNNAHNQAGDKNKWIRVPSIANFTQNITTIVPGLANWLTDEETGEIYSEYITEEIDPALSPREPNDDGFMILSYMESGQNAGIINTYFTLPPVACPSDAVMIEVSLTQAYRKYYDRCYVDYKVNGNWYAREVNITGIDAAVNRWSSNKVRYVLPHSLVENGGGNIELRVRAYSYHRGNAFGYFWAVDNVAVLKLTNTEFLGLNSPTNIDGFYGMMPQGMVIPMTWGVNAQNLSIDNIPNTKATLNAGTTRTALTEVLQGPAVNVMAGNLDATYGVIINERGFYSEDYSADSDMQSWPNEGTHSNYGNAGLPQGFQGRGLPVANTGKNFYSINVSGGSVSNRDYDTILYYVTPNMTFPATSTREGGFRWGHDNGIIPGGASFQVAFTDDHYVTDNGSDYANGGHASMGGYAVHARYITGNDIPEGWVFRGIELIAATDRNADDMEGASIVPIAYVDVYENDGVSFSSLPVGLDGRAFEVSESDINTQLYTEGGYITPDQGYKAINIQFVDQLPIEPNTSYRFGYRLNGDAQFALAGTRNNFRHVSDSGVVNIPFRYGMGVNDTIAEYANAAANAHDYRYVQAPASWLEVLAFDPVEGSYITAANITNYPMIRPIVGPARPVEHAYVSGDCSDNVLNQGDDVNHGVSITRNSDDLCESTIEVTVGSTQRIDFDPIGDHSVIDSVLLNGRALQPYDENTGDGDYLVGDASIYQHPDNPRPDEVLLERSFWVIYMDEFEANQDYTFTVYSHWEPFATTGIDPVAPEAYLTLAPNPATSMVKLNVQGVNGMVNCSILDMSGRVIYNANINAESEHMINVSNIPAGAYFVRVTNDSFSKIEKLIIK